MHLGVDFDALVARFSPNKATPIALGVSGGSDSTALLMLASDWAKKSDRRLIILTVDHQLRSAAASEARYVANMSAAFGHAHKTLQWDTPRNSQAAARRARHRLLADAARQAGASVLLLGHTLDDVTETILLRRRRGVRGTDAAGPVMVSPSPVWPEGRNLTIIRPLLQTSREQLRENLEARQMEWIDDPSNDDTGYERIAIRKHLLKHPKWCAHLRQVTRDLMSKRANDDHALRSALTASEKVSVEPNGLLHLNQHQPSAALLSVLLRAAGGHDHATRRNAIDAAMLDFSTPGDRRTLAGAWLQKTKTGMLIGRDPGETNLRISDGLWDGRYEPASAPKFSANDTPYLVKASAPPSEDWREVISDRIAHTARCYQTPLLNPVQT
ncbi:MAG: tRNA lysidine(34) synthetase TilS [Henriciella sp.]|jgi:tRNA(Ile)-lysidine synthase